MKKNLRGETEENKLEFFSFVLSKHLVNYFYTCTTQVIFVCFHYNRNEAFSITKK